MRMRNLLPSLVSEIVLIVALTGIHHNASGIGRDSGRAVPEADEQPAIRSLDAPGMRRLLGRPGGRKQPLVLYLFYTDCRPCTDRLGEIARLYDQYRDRGLDVALVSIAPMDNSHKLLEVLGHLNAHIPIFLLDKLDDDFCEEFFLRDWEPVVPSVFFYSRGGKLEYSEARAESINFPSLRHHTEKLLRILSGSSLGHSERLRRPE